MPSHRNPEVVGADSWSRLRLLRRVSVVGAATVSKQNAQGGPCSRGRAAALTPAAFGCTRLPSGPPVCDAAVPDHLHVRIACKVFLKRPKDIRVRSMHDEQVGGWVARSITR